MPKVLQNLVKIGQAAQVLSVSIDTLRRWEKQGKISSIRTPGGTRLYSLESLSKINPQSVANFSGQSQTTEELLKRNEDVIASPASVIPLKMDPRLSGDDGRSRNYNLKKSLLTKFLISS